MRETAHLSASSSRVLINMAHQILSNYFTKFHDFNPDPSAPILQEFKRLAEIRNWNGKKYKKEKSKCLLDEYGLYHATLTLGTRSEQLEKARALCSDLGIEPAPASITACKEVWPLTPELDVTPPVISRT